MHRLASRGCSPLEIDVDLNDMNNTYDVDYNYGRIARLNSSYCISKCDRCSAHIMCEKMHIDRDVSTAPLALS